MYKGHNPLRDSIQSYTSMGTNSSQQSAMPVSSSNQGESTAYPNATGHRNSAQRQMENTGSTLNGFQSLESDSKGLDGVIVKGNSARHSSAEPISSQTDVVSALIQRGAKLKEAMILSTLEQPKSTDDTSSTDMGNLYPQTRR